MQIVQAVGDPGSFENPLVSKDYVDGKFNELYALISSLSQKIDSHISSPHESNGTGSTGEQSGETSSGGTNPGSAPDEASLGEITAQILLMNQKINELSNKLNELSDKLSEGTSSDLLVELSKINARVVSLENADSSFVSTLLTQNKRISDIQVTADKLKTDIDELKTALSDIDSKLDKIGTTEPTNTKFEILELKSGQHLVIGASAEMLLRGGSAVAVGSNAGLGGLVDLTSGTGKDVMGGENVPLNHLLMSPRDDGRGLVVTSDTAWVMVKGEYTIK